MKIILPIVTDVMIDNLTNVTDVMSTIFHFIKKIYLIMRKKWKIWVPKLKGGITKGFDAPNSQIYFLNQAFFVKCQTCQSSRP